MKIGDKLYCIKTFKDTYGEFVTEGKTYYVIDFYVNSVGRQTIKIRTNIGVLFFFYDKNFSPMYYAPDFFIDIKTTRKIKLERIENEKLY